MFKIDPERKSISSTESTIEPEQTERQQPTLPILLVEEFDAFIRERRGVTLRDVARKAGFKFPVLDSWRNESSNVSDFDEKNSTSARTEEENT